MSSIRKIATPLTIGSFVLMAMTGILMFFHLDSGLNKAAHEWLGWAMLVGVGLHLVVNWRAFGLYFKRPVAQGIMGVFVLVLGLSFLPLTGDQGGSPAAAAINVVIHAPLIEIAPLLDTDGATLLARLQNAGISATEDQSLSDLTDGDMRRAAGLIGALRG